MNRFKFLVRLVFFTCILLSPYAGFTQIISDADQIIPTEYTSGPQDNIHIFCGQKDERKASLTASFPNGETGSFEWTKYNPGSGSFDFFSADGSGNNTSTISNLENGGYRVKLTNISGETTTTAWVFNNYMDLTAEIPESDCDKFTLKGNIDSPALTYYDITSGQPIDINKNIRVKWMQGNSQVGLVSTIQIFDPPTKDIDYKFEVTDRFGCTGNTTIQYISIVTKAAFSASEDKGEAPLEVTFNNESENGDANKFEWFIFKALDDLKKEKKDNGVIADSILVKLYNDSPVYTFEKSGEYKVKLVSQKVSEFHICYDTVYLPGYIVVDTSFVDAPNVFTPNGDGTNDEFIVKFWSMKSIKISIFNRWGKLLHVWENNNVQGFGPSIESIPQSVWDGKVGGKYCTPGVYYYVVEGIGRDDKRRKANGFFHLFRER